MPKATSPTTTPPTIARRRHTPALPGALDRKPDNAPADLAACYVRARYAVPVLVNGPGDAEHPPLRFRGRLLGAMYARGQVHHYRVEDGNGALFLTPPDWIVDTALLLVPTAALEVTL